MAAQTDSMLGKIHQGDCIAGLKKIPRGTIDLAFADPPFNIGFKYDRYDDTLQDDEYLQWSHQWMTQIHRVLKDNGTFWLAIGDEYAAELKVEAKKIGFHCRSWVIWYYTFGVNCKKKFTRSHAHLFHFVKDEKDFVFNHLDMDLRVPSARQLIYNDARANPIGRMPDDTWILRPQELVNGFEPDEDTWHFPRVAGTFKERAGFHGCQMPEQLLGRIIRTCSCENDIVIDPFSGSSTTVAVAKKLNRRYFSFELSEDYVRLGTERLNRISVGDALNGADEPSMKVLNQKKKQTKSAKKKKSDRPETVFPNEDKVHSIIAAEQDGVVEAFAHANNGYAVDRIIADPILNEDFQLACDRLSVPGTPAERNRFLFRIRKAGKLKSAGIYTKTKTNISWKDIDPFVFASEIAWRQTSNKYCISLDEMFCDPRIASQFDKIAADFAPGFTPLRLRKEGNNGLKRAKLQSTKTFGIDQLNTAGVKRSSGIAFSELEIGNVEEGPGVYLIRESDGTALYAGETTQLASRIRRTFDESGPRAMWLQRSAELEIYILPLQSINHHRFARQSLLLKWHRPHWNYVDHLKA